MRRYTAPTMFTSLLFDHVFDIDDVIRALCGDDHDGRWLLNSRTGELLAEPADDPLPIQDGDDANHWHVLEPLPVSLLPQLAVHPKLVKTAADTHAQVKEKLNNSKTMYQLLQQMDETQAGGWLRERIKDLALDWLDDRQMIPPSMRHVREDRIMGPAGAAVQVKVEVK